MQLFVFRFDHLKQTEIGPNKMMMKLKLDQISSDSANQQRENIEIANKMIMNMKLKLEQINSDSANIENSEYDMAHFDINNLIDNESVPGSIPNADEQKQSQLMCVHIICTFTVSILKTYRNSKRG